MSHLWDTARHLAATRDNHIRLLTISGSLRTPIKRCPLRKGPRSGSSVGYIIYTVLGEFSKVYPHSTYKTASAFSSADHAANSVSTAKTFLTLVENRTLSEAVMPTIIVHFVAITLATLE